MSILVLGSDMCLELRDEIIPRYIYIYIIHNYIICILMNIHDNMPNQKEQNKEKTTCMPCLCYI